MIILQKIIALKMINIFYRCIVFFLFIGYSSILLSQNIDRRDMELDLIKKNSNLPPIDDVFIRKLSPNIVGRKGFTPLMLSAVLDEPGHVERLILMGAEVDRKDDFGRTAAIYALEWNAHRAFLKLLDYDALAPSVLDDELFIETLIKSAKNNNILNDKRVDGFVRKLDQNKINQLLIHATMYGDLSFVQSVIDMGAKPVARLSGGLSAMHTAAKTCNIKLFNLLIEGGGKIDDRDDFGITPLHYAIANDDPECIDYLIRRGANVYVKTNDGATPIDVAIFGGSTKALFVILKSIEKPALYIDDNHLISSALKSNKSPELLSVLLSFGANPDRSISEDLLGTPLHEVILLGEAENAKILINYGAKINSIYPITKQSASDMIRDSKFEAIRSLEQ